jgi:hypothetical protein
MLTLLLAIGILAGPPSFVESGGIVSIEAENYTARSGEWMEVEGRNATILKRGTSPDFRLHAVEGSALSGGLAGETALPRDTWVSWGFAGPGATIGATLGHDSRKAAVFGYPEGAPLPGGGRAPARRAFAPMPQESVPEFARLLRAALEWAGPAGGRALLVTNLEQPSRQEEFLARLLAECGFEPVVRHAAEIDDDISFARLIVLPATVRYEKVQGKLAAFRGPVVVAGKLEVATELGLTPPPVEPVEGGNAMMIESGRPAGHLRFAIHFSQPGSYQVWLLGHSSGSQGSGGAMVSLGRSPATGAGHRLDMQFNSELSWVSRAKAPGPENQKAPVPAEIRVESPGWHNLYVANVADPESHSADQPPGARYPNWRLDKIALMRKGQPEGDGPPETRNASLQPPRDMLVREEWVPRQVWAIRDGFAVVEAEAVDRHPHWVDRREPSGFTGSSYIEWRGPDRSRSIEGLGGNDDALNVRQGPREQWLILRFQAPAPGAYRLDVRNRHQRKDGDNDCWVAPLGHRATPARPIVRLGDSHGDGDGFTWLDWGVRRFEFKAGLNEIYIGGRSPGFGIDRIALYRDGDEAARRRALSLDAPLAALVEEPVLPR